MQTICSDVETSSDGRAAYEVGILAAIQLISAIPKLVSIGTIIPQFQHFHAIFDLIQFKFDIPARSWFHYNLCGLSRGFCRGFTYHVLPRGFPCG